MNSVIICEGSTDYVLLQYYMRKVHTWEDDKASLLKYKKNKSRDLKRINDILTIMSSGGCSNLIHAFSIVLDRNRNCRPNLSDAIIKIAIITDRDEVGTEADFITKINNKLTEYNATPVSVITNNNWTKISMLTSTGIQMDFELLLMVIPFKKKGAMETFLLDAISKKDIYDKQIISKGKKFVKTADLDKKYLKHRRDITKAEFDAYFCIRTSVDQFNDRQDILKNVPWEKYPKIKNDFRLLGDL